MKKLLGILAIVVSAMSLQAQTKSEKDLKAVMTSISDMDKMLGNDYVMMKTAIDVVSATTFSMGECMVLGAYADESHRKMCKDVEKELGANLNSSTWAFEKYDRANECKVKVQTKAGQTENVPYNGFEGSATVKIQSLIEGLNIEAYFYQSKADKNKYIMFFADRGMGFYFDMTKTGATGNSKPDIKNSAADAATGVVPKNVPKTQGLKNKLKR